MILRQKKASAMWKESEESNMQVWYNDLRLLGHFGDRHGAGRRDTGRRLYKVYE